MAEEVSQPAQLTPARPRLGGFELGVRDSTVSQEGPAVAVHATGLAGTPYAGHSAICYCRPIDADSASSLQQAQWFERAQAVRHDRLTPVLAAGVAGQTAFFVEPAISGDRIVQRLRTHNEMTPAQVGHVLADVHEALNAARQVGLNLLVGPDSVRILNNGRAQVSLGLSMCQNPTIVQGSDHAAQFQFALLAAMLLSGQRDPSKLGIESINGPDRATSMPGFRERLNNVAEHVAIVLAKALNADPAQRYPTVQAFVAAYGEALKATADELAFSALEAKNQKSEGMASIYADLIKRYDEHHPEIAGPGGRLGSMHSSSPVPSTPAPTLSEPAPLPVSIGNEPPLSPEVVAMLAGPTYEPVKPKTNPWFAFAAGTVVLIAVFLLIAFLAVSYS